MSLWCHCVGIVEGKCVTVVSLCWDNTGKVCHYVGIVEGNCVTVLG